VAEFSKNPGPANGGNAVAVTRTSRGGRDYSDPHSLTPRLPELVTQTFSPGPGDKSSLDLAPPLDARQVSDLPTIRSRKPLGSLTRSRVKDPNDNEERVFGQVRDLPRIKRRSREPRTSVARMGEEGCS